MSQEFDKQLGAALREKRKERGLSQQLVADAVGVTKNMVSHWELGKRSLYAEELESFCKICGVTIQETFEAMSKKGPAKP